MIGKIRIKEYKILQVKIELKNAKNIENLLELQQINMSKNLKKNLM